MKRNIILAALLAIVSVSASAKITLPKFFGDNMVLQQQTECNLWGTANANKTVTVSTSWNNKTYKTSADKDGKWSLKVSTPSAGGPFDITFSDGEKLTIHNVLIGEVWICSGQSNMEMPMKGFKGQPVEGANSELLACKDNQLRLFTVKRNAQAEPVDTVTGAWNEANAETVRQFSATAYYYGRALRKSLDVPVGLIVVSWGGSACEAWMNRSWIKPEWMSYFKDVKGEVSQANVDKLQQRCPSALYNGMLHPLIGMTIKGVIWYQGEENVSRASTYCDQLSTMIRGWRSEWKEGDFPFYYCQIAPYDYTLIGWNYNSAYLREQQSMVEKLVPNTRMAGLLDAGLKYGIHPRKKRQAGERLALLALGNTYGMKRLPDYAIYDNVEFRGDTAVVAFSNSREWIYFNDGTPTLANYEVAGADGKYYQADSVWIKRNRLYIKSNKVSKPTAVRYGFRDWVDGDLMHDGLPVSSFRTVGAAISESSK